ncbi:hypothetical protein E2562_012905 [Oryza meyeriana var. granulata]|uniref:Uncharacterized protein n=1 Tax=Oryza meyeriana var. granulata TaxID=110450 RepID=A0A6G1CFV1_9ORYZ|nr:hypothetical protein E2562_012905 [Oryza meyeriana var. granulata]
MMSCLHHPIVPVYRAKKYEFGDWDKWEASAFLRLHAQHREEVKRTEFAHHPYRGEDDTISAVRDTPCCFNPMVTRLSMGAKAADDCYEEALLELFEQQGCLGDLEVDLINLTHTH